MPFGGLGVFGGFMNGATKDVRRAGGIRNAFGELGLGLATAASAIGIEALARKTRFRPLESFPEQQTAQARDVIERDEAQQTKAEKISFLPAILVATFGLLGVGAVVFAVRRARA